MNTRNNPGEDLKILGSLAAVNLLRPFVTMADNSKSLYFMKYNLSGRKYRTSCVEGWTAEGKFISDRHQPLVRLFAMSLSDAKMTAESIARVTQFCQRMRAAVF